MSVFFRLTEGVLCVEDIVRSVIHKYTLIIMRTIKFLAIVTIEVEIIRLVKVRAYKRVRNGKIEKVRSHYRGY